MQFTIQDKDNNFILATKPFKTYKAFAKWFSKNIWAFSTTYKFCMGIRELEILYLADNTILIKDKKFQTELYRGRIVS